MKFISHDLLYLIRAILFGFVAGYAIMVFAYYFKPWAEKTFNLKIDTDIWWWSGVAIAIVLGITCMLLLL
jgi:hypothetical protein